MEDNEQQNDRPLSETTLSDERKPGEAGVNTDASARLNEPSYFEGPSNGPHAHDANWLPNILNRVQRFLIDPARAWQAVKSEPWTADQIYQHWALPLILVGPVLRIVLTPLTHYTLGHALMSGIVVVFAALAMLFLGPKVIRMIAPNFNTTVSELEGLQWLAFGSTGSYVGNVVAALPIVWPLSAILSLYTLYILYLGSKHFLHVPEGRELGFTVVSILGMAGVMLVIVIPLSLVLGLIF